MVLFKKMFLCLSLPIFASSKAYSSDLNSFAEKPNTPVNKKFLINNRKTSLKGLSSLLCQSLFSNFVFFNNKEISQTLPFVDLTISDLELSSKLKKLALFQLQINQLNFDNNSSNSKSLDLKFIQISKLRADFWNKFNELHQLLLVKNISKEDLILLIKKEVQIISQKQDIDSQSDNQDLEAQKKLISNFVPTGQIDPHFKLKQKLFNRNSPIEVQSDGKILLAEVSELVNDEEIIHRLIRLNENYRIDESFNSEEVFIRNSENNLNKQIVHVQIQNDGKILVVENFSLNNKNVYRLYRLKENGRIDESFYNENIFNGPFNSFQIQNDGKLLITEYEYSNANANSIKSNQYTRLIRLNKDGRIDTDFQSKNIFNGPIHSIQIQKNGKILLGGGFTSIVVKEKVIINPFLTVDADTEKKYNHLLRLNENGSLDDSFKIGLGFSDWVQSIQVLGNGMILVGGTFSFFNGKNVNHLVGLTEDGDIDGNFNPGKGFDGPVRSVLVQTDGNILIGGWFWHFNRKPHHFLVRLKGDGNFDESFDIGTGFDSTNDSLKIFQNNKTLLVRGPFTTFNGTKLEEEGFVRIGL